MKKSLKKHKQIYIASLNIKYKQKKKKHSNKIMENMNIQRCL